MQQTALVAVLAVVVLCLGQLASAANDPNCGTKGPSGGVTRIVGGQNTSPLEFPWQVSLRYYSASAGWYHTCGATLLNKRWVLTAAHCVNRSNVVNPSMYRVVLGEHDRSKVEGTEVELSVTGIWVSPLWNAARIDGDAAVMKLERDLDLTGSGIESNLGTACIPDAEDLDKLANTNCISTGWGNTAWQGTSPNILQKVTVPVWSHQSCVSRYTGVHTITSLMLCYGENQKGTCQGDSGGPLNCYVNGKWYTYGATSFGVQCAGPTYPSATARISEFSAWIWQTIDANNS